MNRYIGGSQNLLLPYSEKFCKLWLFENLVGKKLVTKSFNMVAGECELMHLCQNFGTVLAKESQLSSSALG